MKTIQRILFPTDFSETATNAFRYCLRLADEYEATILLLHVIYPEYQVMDVPVMAMQATQDKQEAAEVLLQSFVEATLVEAEAGAPIKKMPKVQTKVEIGEPVSVITSISRSENIDLIVMGTNADHSALENFFGSITTGVVERVHCPVWVVPEEAHYTQIESAVYATDLKDDDPYHIWQASQLLEPFHPLLHCVHVTNNGSDTPMNQENMKQFFKTNAPTVSVNFHELSGKSVSEGLEEFSEVNQVDLIVMRAPQHTFLERIFYPSQTRKMALHTRIPLLLYKEAAKD